MKDIAKSKIFKIIILVGVIIIAILLIGYLYVSSKNKEKVKPGTYQYSGEEKVVKKIGKKTNCPGKVIQTAEGDLMISLEGENSSDFEFDFDEDIFLTSNDYAFEKQKDGTEVGKNNYTLSFYDKLMSEMEKKEKYEAKKNLVKCAKNTMKLSIPHETNFRLYSNELAISYEFKVVINEDCSISLKKVKQEELDEAVLDLKPQVLEQFPDFVCPEDARIVEFSNYIADEEGIVPVDFSKLVLYSGEHSYNAILVSENNYDAFLKTIEVKADETVDINGVKVSVYKDEDKCSVVYKNGSIGYFINYFDATQSIEEQLSGFVK